MASSNKNKNISKKVKPIQIPYPNDKTLWSYHMQAIEPINQEINKAFPEYHPMWVILSQSLNISGKQFNHLRESLLQMTIEQCSAYLRIKAWQIRAWENEKQPIPFMAFELLRLVYESAHFRLSHKDWAGWFISRDGRLVSPDEGDLTFIPSDLSGIHWTKQFVRSQEREFKQMQAEITPLRDENQKLRELLVIEGLSDLTQDLTDLESKIAQLKERINYSGLFNIISKIQDSVKS